MFLLKTNTITIIAKETYFLNNVIQIFGDKLLISQQFLLVFFVKQALYFLKENCVNSGKQYCYLKMICRNKSIAELIARIKFFILTLRICF